MSGGLRVGRQDFLRELDSIPSPQPSATTGRGDFEKCPATLISWTGIVTRFGPEALGIYATFSGAGDVVRAGRVGGLAK